MQNNNREEEVFNRLEKLLNEQLNEDADTLSRDDHQENPYAPFEADGLDLIYNIEIDEDILRNGGQVIAPTLTGKGRMNIKPGTLHGAALRLRGKGLTDKRTGETGNLYYIVE